jgi:hypothetical protein
MPISDRDAIDVWRDTYQAVWFRLKQDGRSPRHVIAGWADVKPSTAGAWKRGECTPDGGTMIVLAKAADADGYPALARLNVADEHRLVSRDEDLAVNGDLSDETRDISRLLYEIQEAEKRGDGDALRRCAEELHKEADEVDAEASLKS